MRIHDPDPRFANNFIDANVLDQNGGPEDAAVDEILRLRGGNTFTVLLPYSVKAEMAHPNTPADVKQRAAQLIYSMPVQMTPPELAAHDKTRSTAGIQKVDLDAQNNPCRSTTFRSALMTVHVDSSSTNCA